MADYDGELEEALLEAAGRPKEGGGRSHTPSSNNKRRRASSMSSDDRSDSSPDNDDEDDDDDFDERGGGRSGEQAKGSKMPLKKRFESSDKDGEDGPRDDGYNSEFSYGSDLYKDEEDRQNLANMTELEREMELAERSDKRDTWLALRKSRGNRQAEASSRPSHHRREKDLGPPSSRMRSSVREGTRSKKENALNELVARRQKAQEPSSLRKRRDSGLTPSRETHSPSRKKPRESLSYSESEPPSEDDADSERDDDEHSDMGASGDELGDKGEVPATEADIKSIVIRRSKLAKWFMEPFFEEIIVGCFVRIGIGLSNTGQSTYRICQVKNVDAKDPDKQYKFENFMTCKYLDCVWGVADARWQMVRASDQPASEKEIEEYLRAVDAAKGTRPSKAEVLKKADAILKINQFVYSASTVKQMLQEKKMAASRPVNIALEKDRVLKELSRAEERGDLAEVEKLQLRLKELDLFTNQVKSKDAKAMALAEMNRRNRMENFKNASMLKPVNTFAKEGEAGYDPFSRRWTRSQNYYQSNPKAGEKDTTEGANALDGAEKAGAKASELSEAPKNVESQAAADRRKLYALHNFVLPISLSKLGNTKGPNGFHNAFVQSYMARKAHLEATCGVQVEQNDGRRHSLTLTVNDYKRRRGLL